MCGVVLNLATLSLFPNATVASRMAAYVTSPVATLCEYRHLTSCETRTDDSAVLTWLGGTICMFSLALGIDTVRDIVRKGFLWFIRDPAAQEFHPIREILQRDSKTQARKIAISGLLYTTTIFATFGINILFLRYACGILPLRWSAE
jgi:E3 ubiquitin-protein ligase MARCH6